MNPGGKVEQNEVKNGKYVERCSAKRCLNPTSKSTLHECVTHLAQGKKILKDKQITHPELCREAILLLGALSKA